jgi:hypothetical protein
MGLSRLIAFSPRAKLDFIASCWRGDFRSRRPIGGSQTPKTDRFFAKHGNESRKLTAKDGWSAMTSQMDRPYAALAHEQQTAPLSYQPRCRSRRRRGSLRLPQGSSARLCLRNQSCGRRRNWNLRAPGLNSSRLATRTAKGLSPASHRCPEPVICSNRNAQ